MSMLPSETEMSWSPATARKRALQSQDEQRDPKLHKPTPTPTPMETALFSAASLFRDADDDQGTLTSPLRVLPRAPPPPDRRLALVLVFFFVCLVLCCDASEDEMQVDADEQVQSVQYEERAHKFPGMVRAYRFLNSGLVLQLVVTLLLWNQ